MLAFHRCGTAFIAMLVVSVLSCTSVPPEVTKLHLKEQEIIESLRKSHLAIVDAYMDKRIEKFERFFFDKYGPVYYKNWKEEFQKEKGRTYDPARNFSLLYEDLVAEYQAEFTSIDQMRARLRHAVTAEYGNALDAHLSIGKWLDTLEKLNTAQRQAVNMLLGFIHPELSLDKFDNAVEETVNNIRSKMSKKSSKPPK